jgi:phosphatidylglycerol:prolipoprotein diacylglycerol transferase
MRRVLWARNGLTLYSFPAFQYLGLVCGMIAQNAAANAAGLDAARVYVATLLLLPLTLAGGRLLFVATHWSVYRREPWRIWRRSEGGLAMYGGVPAMLLASIPVLAWIGLPFWAFWDVATFCILVAMAFSRTGCLLNGCCAGAPTDGRLGIWLPDEWGVLARRMPTQVLEIGWGLVLLVAAVAAWPWRPFPGALFLSALAGYAVGRFALQPTRAGRRRAGPFDLPGAISAALAVLALTGLLLLRP